MACEQGCYDISTDCVGQDCPPPCNCTSNDIVYNGANDLCTGITYNSKLTEVLSKIFSFTKNRLYSIISSQTIKATNLPDACNKSALLDVIISPVTDNILVAQSDGLYVPPTEPTILDYKVKVNVDDTPDYLAQQIEGDNTGLTPISVVDNSGTIKISSTLDVEALLSLIQTNYGDTFCELVAACISYTWVEDTYNCESSDLDLITNKTISNLPNPVYSFEDGGRLYFVSGANNVGKVWSLDPTTATTVSDITYLKETRNGQPYGVSGGTYVSGTNYLANASGTGTPIIIGSFYDKSSRTLYIHSGRSYGCDYYDFVAGTWGKINVGTTGSIYNTTVSTDYYTHISMASNDMTDIIITGWGTDSTDRGSRVITISKSSKALIAEVDTTVTSTFAGITGNPFNKSWGAHITSDNRLFISKSNVSTYRNVAVFNSNLTPILEIVLANSTVGFDGGSSDYWQTSFIDVNYNKFYSNDYMSRTMEVYDTNTYSLLKTFTFNNNRTYPCTVVSLNINGIDNKLYIDLIYGGTSASTSDDAPSTDMISYAIDRTTLDISKIYVGTPKAASLTQLANSDIVSTSGGDVVPSAPTATGISTFYSKNTNSLKNGIVDILTLKEINANTSVPTGATKPNSVSDPNYIAPYTDTTKCPVNYSLNAPDAIVATVTPSRYSIEFGLDDDVILNPALFKISYTLYKSSTQIGSGTWNIPNTPNRNAFFKSGTISGVSAGDTITINLIYYDISNSPIATYNAINVFAAVS